MVIDYGGRGKPKINRSNKMAKKILNQIVQHMNFYFDCSHCCRLNDDFTEPSQITQGIKCEGCGEKNYFEEF